MTRPSRVRPLDLALGLGLIAGVVHVQVGLWHATTWAAVGVTLVLAPFALTVVYSGWYRALVAGRIFPAFAAWLTAGGAIAALDGTKVVAFLWCLGAFITALPVTRRIGRAWAQPRSRQ